MAQDRLQSGLHERLRAEALPIGLRLQHLRPCRGSYQDHVHIVLVESGLVELEGIGAELGVSAELGAASGVILPAKAELLLKIAPGTEGWLFGLAPQILGEIIGNRPEVEPMLPLRGQIILCPDTRGSPMAMEALARAILAEKDGTTQGSAVAILAYLRLIILGIWRGGAQDSGFQPYGGEGEILENFRREVEIHFRNHLSIADYAARLGLSQTRLRRICLRKLNRTPMQLVHMRLLREAAQWLDHSTKSIAEVGFALGFAESSEFSHFFKRGTGLSPKAYRESRRAAADARASDLACFADWP